MAVHPLRSATDRRLGRPLPHQLTNQTQAHPLPINLCPLYHAIKRIYVVLIPVSRGYPSARGRLPTRYSPVRRFPLLTSTEASVKSFSLDLHVLGTPPAFILSQDQTLFQWYQIFPSRKSFNLVCLAHFTLLALCDLFRNLFVFFLEFPETFKLFSSCPSSFHLPEASRLPFAGFLCYEIFMVLALFGHRPLFQRTSVILSHLLSCLSATFFYFFRPSF